MMDFGEIISVGQEYGPTCLRVGLLVMFAYHAWQRNVARCIISMGAVMATFILGW